jgi:2-amino-4-hydroxy-6-hydroxymethyldihydropteridine diphosphokinase
VRLLIGLGGNLGDVPRAFVDAVSGLREHLQVLALSGVWRGAPQGPPQPDYLNAVALVQTAAHPNAVLALCQGIERDAGRDRSREQRWGPRTLDLDLLIAPGFVTEGPDLVLPHPRLAERRFALAPAAEVAADWLHPRLHRTIARLAAAPETAAQRCERIGPFPAV